jgi:hypothetical protein
MSKLHQVHRLARLCAASAVTLLLTTGILSTGPSVASAANGPIGFPTVIGFDNLSAGTVVSNQYAGLGVTFDQAPSGPAGYLPRVLSAPAAAHSRPNVLDIEQLGSCGAGGNRVGLWAHLTAPRNYVSVYVGDIQSPASEQATLVGYDRYGTPIPGVTDTVSTTGGGTYTPLSITDPGNRIVFFQVQGPANADCFAVDDVEFSPPAPDTVTVTNPGNLDTDRGQPIRLQIPAASNYGYSLTACHATGLPRGVSISATCLIYGTPTLPANTPVTVTATDTHGVSGSTTFTWTVQQPCKPPFCS